MNLFGRTIRYEDRAHQAIQAAEDKWDDVDEIINAFEWILMRDPELGRILTESGKVRGFLYPGAKSKNEPDVDVIYEVDPQTIIIHDLTFTDAKAQYAGQA
ncbi:MAG TPA: hypothetical protein VFB31_01540 [Pseudolabrys sp.]|nr:hypothetical protein [Pseudolabrys sp.]